MTRVQAGQAHDDVMAPAPIIDFLAYEPELNAYVVDFVPELRVSDAQKESVQIREGSSTARRVRELLAEMGALCGFGGPVERIAHGGGGDFELSGESGGSLQLQPDAPPPQNYDLYAVLQILAQEVQYEFILQQRSGHRRAAR